MDEQEIRGVKSIKCLRKTGGLDVIFDWESESDVALEAHNLLSMITFAKFLKEEIDLGEDISTLFQNQKILDTLRKHLKTWGRFEALLQSMAETLQGKS